MKRFLSLLIASVAGLAFAPAQRDGGFQQRDVVGGAMWYLHVDLVSLKGSRVGQELMTKIDGDAKRKIKAFERMISFNPLEDLDSVTLSGTAAEPEKAVVLLRGVFDIPHLTDLARGAEGYAESSHGGRAVHSWDDEKKPGQRLHACMLSENAMVFGPDLELVKAAIDGRQAKPEGPGGGVAVPEFPGPAGRKAPFASAWADFAVLDSVDIESAFVRRVRAAHFAVGEDGGRAFARITADTTDERAPELMEKMVAGALALAEAAEQLPAAIVDGVEVESVGRRMVLDVALELDALVELVEGLEELKAGL